MTVTRLVNARICTRDGLVGDNDLVIRDGRIHLEKASDRKEACSTIDAKGACILPGFIEIHTHGAGLFEFTAGLYNPQTKAFESSPEVYEKQIPRYVRLRTATGVTSLYPGTWAAPIEQLRFCFEQLRRYMESGNNGKQGCRIRGGVLEGAFFNPRMAGAQNPDYSQKPDVETFDRINEAGIIRLANVVPDSGKDAYDLIRNLTDKRISVGAGHTNATAEQFHEAVDNGLKYVIHFLNGPTGGSYKSFGQGGAVEGILRDDRIYAELILDGVHVSPAYTREVIGRKGMDKVMAVTDAMFASQAEGVRDFEISGIPGRLSEDNRYVYVVGKERLTLFSSVLTMDKAFSNVLSFLTRDVEGTWHRQHEALSLKDAVPVAARICSTNIADMLRTHGCEDLQTGAIEQGQQADLVMADIEGQPGDYHLTVRKVFVHGNEVYSS